MFGYLTGTAWNSVDRSGRVPRRRSQSYAFVGAQPGNAVYYMRADTPPGIKAPADLMKARGPRGRRAGRRIPRRTCWSA